MNSKITLFVLLVLLGFSNSSKAQTNPCPDNIDFELGTTANWEYSIGTCCPITTPFIWGALPSRHALTSGAALDPYGSFPIVSPGGGSYSMRLGNDSNGADGEKARYYVRVPTGVVNFALVYRYAVVLENPGHSPSVQPRFEVNAYDSATTVAVPCASYSYVADASLPGFILSPVGSLHTGGGPVNYKSWTTATINLSGLGGTTVTIDFASGDCSASGHFGYGYFDMSCGLFQVSGVTCDDTATTSTLSAPFGYEFYTWYDSATFTVVYGATRTITIPLPGGPTTYAVILTPYAGYGCPDTLYTTISPSHLRLNPTPDTLVCSGFGATITSGATDIAVPLTYSWSPATGLSCTNCANPVAAPGSTTVYSVHVTNAVGCTRDTTIRVRVGHVSSVVTGTDVTCDGLSNGTGTVTVTAGTPPFSYVWSTTPIQTTPTATGLFGGPPGGSVVYTVTVTDASGCTDTHTLTVNDGPVTLINITASSNPTNCLDSNGTITLNGLVAGATFTITYLFDGVFQSQTLVAGTGGVVVLTGLKAGTYSNITVVATGTTNFCPYNVVGPLVLSDPPNPARPVLTSNSAVCLGDPLTLGSTSTPGVSYSWTGPAGFSSGVQNPTVAPTTYANGGIYHLIVELNNCFNEDSILVVIKPYPFPSAANNSALCSGDTLFLTSSSSNGASSYLWNGPAGFYSYSQNPFIDHITVASAGTYSVTVSLNGCYSTTTTDVVVNQTPDAPTVADLEYCQFDVAPALTAGGTGLRWYTTATGGTASTTAPVPSTLVPGKFVWYVSQVSTAGCESIRSKITVQVDYFATPTLEITDSVICRGTDITFTAIGTGDDITRLTWVFGDDDSLVNQNPAPHAFDRPGTFTVTAYAYYKVCPTKTASANVIVYPSPSVYIGSDTTICPGGVPLILSDNINAKDPSAKWYWSTGSSLSAIKVTNPGTYFVKVSIAGCNSTDTIIVLNDCYMNLPNVFTPNGDGMNDYFFPRQLLTKGLTSFNMNIYNRWGELVFTTNTLDGKGWDGKFNNSDQPEGVFIYIIDATFKDGQKENHKGNVTLLR